MPPAGIDPAYIPGLTPPPPAEGRADDAVPTADIPPEAAEITPGKPGKAARSATAPEADESAEGAPRLDKGALVADDAGPEDAAAGSESAADGDADVDGDVADADESAADGLPVFEVTDRRGAIIADAAGVTFRLDDQEAEFGWDEIGAVEIDTPRFGRRFSVTVYTSTRRWFQTDVEAPSRAVLKQWTAELDAVLDARFEEGGTEEESEPGVSADKADITDARPEVEAEAEAEADAEVDGDADAEVEEKPAKATGKAGTESKA